MKKVSLLLAVLLLLNVLGLGAFSSALAAGSPRAPEGLEAKAVSGSVIDLSWSDRSNDEIGFIIERSAAENGDYVPIHTVGRNVKVFSDTGLTPGTVYWYRVKAYNKAGVSEPSNAAFAATFAPPPAAPAGLKATAATDTQINLSWTDRSDNEAGFKIERKTGEGDFQEIADVGANIAFYADTGLTPGVAYTYRVRAYNIGGVSDYSNTAGAVTGGVPSAPQDLKAAASGAQIRLTWKDTSNNEAGFKIERKAGSGDFVQIDAVKANSTAYLDTDVTAGVLYTYRVRAYNDAGDSGYSAEASSALESAPAAPSNLTAVPVSKYQIKLTWTDNASNEEGFKIERRTEGGKYVQIAEVEHNTTTYTDSWLSPNKTYYYRVRAYNSRGHSEYSNESSAVTGVVPAAPSDLAAEAVSRSQITLSWKDNSDNETGFKIERRTSGGSYVQIATLGANKRSYTDTGLSPNTSYYYRVRAYNSVGNSPYSNEVVVSTGVPAAPTGLTATAVSENAIMLTWEDNASNETGFKIERKTSGGSFAQVATAGANTRVYYDNGLAADTVYYYRVRAYNSAGNSPYSSEVKAATPAEAQHVIVLHVGKTAYYVDNQRRVMDTVPIIRENRTFLPIRYVAEPLGAALTWDAAQQKVTITFKGKVIELWIGSNAARVDGKMVSIDPENPNVKPLIVPPGRTMLPLRFISENLGCRVDWNSKTQQITVTYPAP
ncbi:MAG: hypothetical protein GXZ07_02240 [Firmicutes bacterium]|nr:hypothetical protein [Bacillota bacterium]